MPESQTTSTSAADPAGTTTVTGLHVSPDSATASTVQRPGGTARKKLPSAAERVEATTAPDDVSDLLAGAGRADTLARAGLAGQLSPSRSTGHVGEMCT